jgi:4a-hydroxytetrahydrobiopterin dehydratase
MDALTKKHCKPCEGGVPPLKDDEVRKLLSELNAWELKEEGMAIVRHFQFSDYYKTMAFVNAIAWMAHQEDHHPDLEVSYNFCRVRYTTHAIGGLSENDFICAAKVDELLQLK